MLTRREALGLMSATGVAATLLAGCAEKDTQQERAGSESQTKNLRILATSDLHGMFVPWDYMLDAENTQGSMAQLSGAMRELRDDQTLIIDAGDTIQGNLADLFQHEEVHPMVICMNELGYDIGVAGNHDFDYGLDVLRSVIDTFTGKMLVGNARDEGGEAIADGYTIIERDGVRVGIIGMVTPLVARWDEIVLEGCTIGDAVEETRHIIDEIKDNVDVLIGVMHMGLENEAGTPHTGVRDIAEACPEFDCIIAAHDHKLVGGDLIGGVLVVENRYHAQTIVVIDLSLEGAEGGWKVTDRTSYAVEVGDFEPDPKIVALMADFDERAKLHTRTTIGTLVGGPLVEKGEFEAIPEALLADTALIDLIHEVQLHHSGADVSSTSLMRRDISLEPGPIRRCDVSQIYPYDNTLYTIEMTGSQLRRYLEWSARFYRTFEEGDLTLAFDPDIALFNYDMFQGVSYAINVSREPGKRIEDLAWPDGTPVADDDVFVLATNNYRAGSFLLMPGPVFEEDDLPTLIEPGVHGTIGGIREMICDYIENVQGGTIKPVCDDNWRLVGCD